MKRLWIGAGILVLFLVVGILLSMAFCRIHGPLAQTLEDACDLAFSGNWEQACTLAEDARMQWKRYRNFTAAVADHAPLEEMDSLFSQLEQYEKLGWQGEFSCLCRQLAQMAMAMEESQQLTWWTLL